MRFLPVVAILCPVLALCAASPWDEFLQRRQGLDPRRARWTLCLRAGAFTSADLLKDDELQKLIIGGDLSAELLGPGEADDLWSRQSWSGPGHWVLLNPAGTVAVTASGPPRGEALVGAMRTAGDPPRWEVREAFLKGQPEQGEALLEEASFQFRLSRARLMALDQLGKVRIPVWHADAPQGLGRVVLPDTDEGRALADTLFPDLAKALARLFAVAGWPTAAPNIAGEVSLWDLSRSSAMRAVFAPAAARAETLLRKDPQDAGLLQFWVEAREAAGLPPASPGGQFTPVPGQVWPNPSTLSKLLEPYRRRQDWEGALKCLSGLTPTAPPKPLSSKGWEDHCRLQCALLVQKGLAYAYLGSWDLAAGAMEDARLWGGGQGVREALIYRGTQWVGAGPEPPSWRAFLSQALSKEGPRPPMPALDPPLRLVVMGQPKWLLDWSQLARTAELLPWSPAELRWEVASRDTQERLKRGFDWAPGPRWALLRGDELRATGTVCPEPKALATILEGEGNSVLQRLTRALDNQPDHLGVRRARFNCLLPRMPEPRLEGLLARDGAEGRMALPFDAGAPWKPDLDTWAAAAQELLPKVEEELRSWPNRTALWRAWISWAPFHPRQPSILALAQGLSFWSPQGDWRAGLPYPVQRAVAAELRRQGSFDAMRTWFRSAWDALDQRPYNTLRPGEREWILERRREEETAIFQPLRDALRALACNQEQADLERAFSAMMGQDMTRRR